MAATTTITSEYTQPWSTGRHSRQSYRWQLQQQLHQNTHSLVNWTSQQIVLSMAATTTITSEYTQPWSTGRHIRQSYRWQLQQQLHQNTPSLGQLDVTVDSLIDGSYNNNYIRIHRALVNWTSQQIVLSMAATTTITSEYTQPWSTGRHSRQSYRWQLQQQLHQNTQSLGQLDVTVDSLIDGSYNNNYIRIHTALVNWTSQQIVLSMAATTTITSEYTPSPGQLDVTVDSLIDGSYNNNYIRIHTALVNWTSQQIVLSMAATTTITSEYTQPWSTGRHSRQSYRWQLQQQLHQNTHSLGQLDVTVDSLIDGSYNNNYIRIHRALVNWTSQQIVLSMAATTTITSEYTEPWSTGRHSRQSYRWQLQQQLHQNTQSLGQLDVTVDSLIDGSYNNNYIRIHRALVNWTSQQIALSMAATTTITSEYTQPWSTGRHSRQSYRWQLQQQLHQNTQSLGQLDVTVDSLIDGSYNNNYIRIHTALVNWTSQQIVLSMAATTTITSEYTQPWSTGRHSRQSYRWQLQQQLHQNTQSLGQLDVTVDSLIDGSYNNNYIRIHRALVNWTSQQIVLSMAATTTITSEYTQPWSTGRHIRQSYRWQLQQQLHQNTHSLGQLDVTVDSLIDGSYNNNYIRIHTALVNWTSQQIVLSMAATTTITSEYTPSPGQLDVTVDSLIDGSYNNNYIRIHRALVNWTSQQIVLSMAATTTITSEYTQPWSTGRHSRQSYRWQLQQQLHQNTQSLGQLDVTVDSLIDGSYNNNYIRIHTALVNWTSQQIVLSMAATTTITSEYTPSPGQLDVTVDSLIDGSYNNNYIRIHRALVNWTSQQIVLSMAATTTITSEYTQPWSTGRHSRQSYRWQLQQQLHQNTHSLGQLDVTVDSLIDGSYNNNYIRIHTALVNWTSQQIVLSMAATTTITSEYTEPWSTGRHSRQSYQWQLQQQLHQNTQSLGQLDVTVDSLIDGSYNNNYIRIHTALVNWTSQQIVLSMAATTTITSEYTQPWSTGRHSRQSYRWQLQQQLHQNTQSLGQLDVTVDSLIDGSYNNNYIRIHTALSTGRHSRQSYQWQLQQQLHQNTHSLGQLDVTVDSLIDGSYNNNYIRIHTALSTGRHSRQSYQWQLQQQLHQNTHSLGQLDVTLDSLIDGSYNNNYIRIHPALVNWTSQQIVLSMAATTTITSEYTEPWSTGRHSRQSYRWQLQQQLHQNTHSLGQLDVTVDSLIDGSYNNNYIRIHRALVNWTSQQIVLSMVATTTITSEYTQPWSTGRHSRQSYRWQLQQQLHQNTHPALVNWTSQQIVLSMAATTTITSEYTQPWSTGRHSRQSYRWQLQQQLHQNTHSLGQLDVTVDSLIDGSYNNNYIRIHTALVNWTSQQIVLSMAATTTITSEYTEPWSTGRHSRQSYRWQLQQQLHQNTQSLGQLDVTVDSLIDGSYNNNYIRIHRALVNWTSQQIVLSMAATTTITSEYTEPWSTGRHSRQPYRWQLQQQLHQNTHSLGQLDVTVDSLIDGSYNNNYIRATTTITSEYTQPWSTGRHSRQSYRWQLQQQLHQNTQSLGQLDVTVDSLIDGSYNNNYIRIHRALVNWTSQQIVLSMAATTTITSEYTQPWSTGRHIRQSYRWQLQQQLHQNTHSLGQLDVTVDSLIDGSYNNNYIRIHTALVNWTSQQIVLSMAATTTITSEYTPSPGQLDVTVDSLIDGSYNNNYIRIHRALVNWTSQQIVLSMAATTTITSEYTQPWSTGRHSRQSYRWQLQQQLHQNTQSLGQLDVTVDSLIDGSYNNNYIRIHTALVNWTSQQIVLSMAATTTITSEYTPSPGQLDVTVDSLIDGSYNNNYIRIHRALVNWTSQQIVLSMAATTTITSEYTQPWSTGRHSRQSYRWQLQQQLHQNTHSLGQLDVTVDSLIDGSYNNNYIRIHTALVNWTSQQIVLSMAATTTITSEYTEPWSTGRHSRQSYQWQLQQQLHQNTQSLGQLDVTVDSLIDGSYNNNYIRIHTALVNWTSQQIVLSMAATTTITSEYTQPWSTGRHSRQSYRWQLQQQLHQNTQSLGQLDVTVDSLIDGSYNNNYIRIHRALVNWTSQQIVLSMAATTTITSEYTQPWSTGRHSRQSYRWQLQQQLHQNTHSLGQLDVTVDSLIDGSYNNNYIRIHTALVNWTSQQIVLSMAATTTITSEYTEPWSTGRHSRQSYRWQLQQQLHQNTQSLGQLDVTVDSLINGSYNNNYIRIHTALVNWTSQQIVLSMAATTTMTSEYTQPWSTGRHSRQSYRWQLQQQLHQNTHSLGQLDVTVDSLIDGSYNNNYIRIHTALVNWTSQQIVLSMAATTTITSEYTQPWSTGRHSRQSYRWQLQQQLHQNTHSLGQLDVTVDSLIDGSYNNNYIRIHTALVNWTSQQIVLSMAATTTITSEYTEPWSTGRHSRQSYRWQLQQQLHQNTHSLGQLDVTVDSLIDGSYNNNYIRIHRALVNWTSQQIVLSMAATTTITSEYTQPWSTGRHSRQSYRWQLQQQLHQNTHSLGQLDVRVDSLIDGSYNNNYIRIHTALVNWTSQQIVLSMAATTTITSEYTQHSLGQLDVTVDSLINGSCCVTCIVFGSARHNAQTCIVLLFDDCFCHSRFVVNRLTVIIHLLNIELQ